MKYILLLFLILPNLLSASVDKMWHTLVHEIRSERIEFKDVYYYGNFWLRTEPIYVKDSSRIFIHCEMEGTVESESKIVIKQKTAHHPWRDWYWTETSFPHMTIALICCPDYINITFRDVRDSFKPDCVINK